MAGVKKRQYHFLGKQVSKDYSKVKNVLVADREVMHFAEEVRREKELELLGGIRGIKVQTALDDFSLVEYLEAYQDKTKNGQVKSLLYNINKFSKEEDVFISEVTPEWLEDFKNFLISRISVNGAISYLISFKSRLNDLIKEGKIKQSPFKYFTIPVQQETEITTLDESQVRQLVSTPFPSHPQVRLAFLFSCFTGLRISDVRALRWHEVQERISSNGTTYLQTTIKPIKTEKTTDKILSVPLSVPAMKVLEEIKGLSKNEPKPNDRVFDNLPSERYAQDMLKLWVARAGLKINVHFHVGRHTFATLCLTNGIHLYTVSKLLGHGSVRTTEIYAKIVDEKKRMEIKKLPKL